MLLTNCKINLMLAWSANCVISSNVASNRAVTFAMTDNNLYVRIVT